MFSMGNVTPEAVAPRAPIMDAMEMAMETLGIRDIIAMPSVMEAMTKSKELRVMANRFPCSGIPATAKRIQLASRVWVMKRHA